MTSNLERYKRDLERLIKTGVLLFNAIQFECYPNESRDALKKQLKKGGKIEPFLEMLPDFKEDYNNWYSEALAIIKVVLPDRLINFISLYEKPKSRKEIQFGNYVIADYLQGISRRDYSGAEIVSPRAAIPQFQQQLNILKAAKNRFESTLFDIRQMLQADLFDSEIDAAKELCKNGFYRGAGAIAGVVLEKHLGEVSTEHKLSTNKKGPSISDYNQLLKNENVIDVKEWRFIQHLADLRNLCDHNKEKEPKKEDVEELIEGVAKVIKRLY